ncbi:MAG: glycoside hydrolase family 13 protein [Bacteroidales bacterium]|nr:glycoside hydrolase family 13 protein [Bacteroidales bacterium]
MKKLIIIILLFATSTVFAQKINLERVEPPNWWVGMKNQTVQLLVYGENISLTDISISSEKVKLQKIHKIENPNYLFLDVEVLSNAKPGSFDIVFSKGLTIIKQKYELKEKSSRIRGFSSADLIYLLMPDRFANGNPKNDFPSFSNLESLPILEKPDRNDPDGRHGGDIQGVIEHLNYIKELGVTTLWLNPTLENNNPAYSYHGYAITDFYKTDPRSGTNEDYKRLSNELHKKDMKLIMDMIFNHCSSNHWWMKDLPMKDWANTNPDYRSNFRGSTIADIHASKDDQKRMTQGWFDNRMPDLNQHNHYLATYLIQNSIWWIEYADLDGIRMDTQPYPFKDFMSAWAKQVREEYPDITLLGETWLQKPAFTAYFSGNSPISGDYNSHLNSITDFPLYYATRDAFNQNDGWTDGLSSIYYILAQDFLYENANNNVIFLDNHDLNRYFTSVGEDVNKLKMGLAFLLTSRGIPMLYYGTEILTTGHEHKGHGHIRTDFPGGWKNDKINAFTKEGRTKEQNKICNYIKTIADWRKTNKAVTEGKLLHFVPENNVYVFFRYTDNEAVMVLLNNHNSQKRTVDCKRFNEILKEYSKGKNILTDEIIDISKTITINKKSALIIELEK